MMTNEPPTEKECIVCGTTRPISEFSIRLSCLGGRDTTCKPCNRVGGLAHTRRAERRAAVAAGTAKPVRSPKHEGEPTCRSCFIVLRADGTVDNPPSATRTGLCESCARKRG
jgi:hypothetical protein